MTAQKTPVEIPCRRILRELMDKDKLLLIVRDHTDTTNIRYAAIFDSRHSRDYLKIQRLLIDIYDTRESWQEIWKNNNSLGWQPKSDLDYAKIIAHIGMDPYIMDPKRRDLAVKDFLKRFSYSE